MSQKQFAALFICSLVPWAAGNGLIPLLPLYAHQLGASAAGAGFILSGIYVAITVGALAAGWVSDGLRRRRLPLIVISLAVLPLTWTMGRVQSLWALTAVAALIWLCGGLELAFISILAGLSAGENERGRVFGALALTGGLGALVGGLGVGWLVDRWGYTTMFVVLTIWSAILPLTALFVEEKVIEPSPATSVHGTAPTGLGRDFYWLFAATVLFAIPVFFALLIRSLVMDKFGFRSLEITSTGAIGGLVSLPFPFLLGWISDRIGRKPPLYFTFLLGLTSFGLLAFSSQLWHFLLAFALSGIAQGGLALGGAFVTDLVPRESLGKGLAVNSSAVWIGAVVGFSVAGFTLQNLGLGPTFVLGGLLALAAVGLLIPIGRPPLVRAQAQG